MIFIVLSYVDDIHSAELVQVLSCVLLYHDGSNVLSCAVPHEHNIAVTYGLVLCTTHHWYISTCTGTT